MAQTAEPVPFAFVAEAGRRQGRAPSGRSDGYTSNIAPPGRERVPLRTACGRAAVGLVLLAGLVAAVVLGKPALSAPSGTGTAPDARPALVSGRH